ncbi:MAG: hypothetical protein WCB11_05950, partial [Terriglobales bacterium]
IPGGSRSNAKGTPRSATGENAAVKREAALAIQRGEPTEQIDPIFPGQLLDDLAFGLEGVEQPLHMLNHIATFAQRALKKPTRFPPDGSLSRTE